VGDEGNLNRHKAYRSLVKDLAITTFRFKCLVVALLEQQGAKFITPTVVLIYSSIYFSAMKLTL
jgi:hypothetical protein